MAVIYLSIGSNIDRQQNITAALDALVDNFGQLLISSVYESEAVGFNGDPFYNLVVGITSGLSVGALFNVLRDIEFKHGRCRSGERFSSRTLDVDILSYDDAVGEIEGVKLPREEVLYNAFVLQPLAEIAPDDMHPVEQKTYQQLWTEYDKNKQKLWPVDFIWRGEQISNLRR